MSMPTKNIGKGASFRYAFGRINESIKAEFYLEAIALSESIISDRLLSFVKHNTEKASVKTDLSMLIRTAKKFNDRTAVTKDGRDLFDALDAWRVDRNNCLHSAAKSEPGTATVSVDHFLKLAKNSALAGKALARAVCEWDRRRA